MEATQTKEGGTRAFRVRSWLRREASSDPDGLLRYPLKMLIPAAFALLALQGVSAILHCIAFLRKPRTPAGDRHV